MKTFLQYLQESKQDLLKVVPSEKVETLLSKKSSVKLRKIHDKVFGAGNNQIILDAGVDELPEQVVEFLNSKGVNTKSKEGNHIVDSLNLQYGKSTMSILKFLGRNKAPADVVTAMENFNRAVTNQSKSGSLFKILISRNPAEVAASSTGTAWDSCMNPVWKNGKPFTGPAWKSIPAEIKNGTLVAYVLRASAVPNEEGEYNAQGADGKHDKIGRVLIKMFESETGDISFFVENKAHGTVTPNQLKIINDWVKSNYHIKAGTFHRAKGVYNDDGTSRKTVKLLEPLPEGIIIAKDKQHLIQLIEKYEGHDDLNFIDVSNVTDMSELFDFRHGGYNHKFNGDISKWDVSKVTDMSKMFRYSSFNGDVSNWNVSSVKNMNSMFSSSRFNGNISKWNVSKVTDMSGMFFQSQFNGDISKWNVSNVTDMMGMFSHSAFNRDISDWVVSKVKMFSSMFKKSKFSQNIDNWNVQPAAYTSDMIDDSPLEDNPPRWYKG